MTRACADRESGRCSPASKALLQDLKLAASLGDFFLRRLGKFVRVHRDRRGQLSHAENLYRRIAMHHARLLEHFGGNFSLAKCRQAAEVYHIVFFAENVGEAALGNAAMERHLAAFKSANEARARP